MASGGRLLRSVDEPRFTAAPGRAPRERPAPTLIYKTDPNMRATHEGARPKRPVIEEFDDMMGASRATNFRLKLARLIRKRRLGFGLVAAFYAGVGVLGMIDGGHWPVVKDEIQNAHITTANALGFNVVGVQTEGQSALTDDEVLLALGIKEDTALPFLDVKAARERLMANPLVAEATVRKLYPDRVTVHLTERKPFALWQHDGKVQILAADGTAIDEFRDSRFAHLPLVVGPSANLKAEKLLEALDAAPKIKAETYAAVLVAERRWNLRLRSGVEVKLPETGFAEALTRLEGLQENENLLSRWIDVVDLREPDRTIVRLSEEAAASVAEDEKAAAKTKKKGGQT